MLMCCGMENNVGFIMCKDCIYTGRVANRSYFDIKLQLILIFSEELLLNVVSIVFVNIKNNQFSRLSFGNLTAKLASDGAATACN